MFGVATEMVNDTILALKYADPENDPEENLDAQIYYYPVLFRISRRAEGQRREADRTLDATAFQRQLSIHAASVPYAGAPVGPFPAFEEGGNAAHDEQDDEHAPAADGAGEGMAASGAGDHMIMEHAWGPAASAPAGPGAGSFVGGGAAPAGFGTGIGAGRSAEQGAGPADVAAAPGEGGVGGARTGVLIPIGAGRDGVWPELALPSGPGRAAASAKGAKSTESKPGMMTAAKMLARRKKG